MMRVLMIVASAGYGGGPQHVFDLAKTLHGKVLVDIACPQQLPFYERFRGVIEGEMIEIPERRFTVSDAWRLLVSARNNGVSLLHSHGKGAGVYGRFVSALSGLPLVHTPHGIHIDQYGLLMRAAYLSYERATGWIGKKTIFVSPSEAQRALDLKIGKQSRSIVISNGVPVPGSVEWKIAARDRIRKERRLGEEDIVVATLSRFDYAKNMEEMVRVADLARNLQFWFLGDGPGFCDIKAATTSSQMKHVWLPGFVNNPLDYLAAADIYLSTSRWEGLPLAVLQAMSLGKPVVASDVTGNRDAVQCEVTGYLYPLGQPLKASEYLQILNSSQKLRKEMGDAGLARQQAEFSVDQMGLSTLQVYTDVHNRH